MKNNEIEFIFEYNSSVNAPSFLEATEQLVGIKLNDCEKFDSAA